jgi:D-sedoheptulose 7-phosphate isomerase
MDEIITIFRDSADTKVRFAEGNAPKIEEVVQVVVRALQNGKKLLIFGNGGSAADAQHIAAEFVNRFQIERPPLAAIALTTDTSILTSIGNDYHFDEIFSKQVSALGKKDDIAIGISTSGNSKNVIEAVTTAKDIGLFTIGMTGRGGKLAECADLLFRVESDTTARIQEAHSILGHILCDLVDRILYPEEFNTDIS